MAKRRKPTVKIVRKTKRGKRQDRALVAGKQAYEVAYVAKRAGVTREQVRAAVKKAGHSRKKITDELEK